MLENNDAEKVMNLINKLVNEGKTVVMSLRRYNLDALNFIILALTLIYSKKEIQVKVISHQDGAEVVFSKAEVEAILVSDPNIENN